MRPLLVDRETAAWLRKQAPFLAPRSWPVLVAPNVVRMFHPCGHTSLHDMAKEKPRGWSPAATALMVKRWTADWSGVHSTCPRCYRRKAAEAKAKRVLIPRPKNLGRASNDWAEGGAP